MNHLILQPDEVEVLTIRVISTTDGTKVRLAYGRDEEIPIGQIINALFTGICEFSQQEETKNTFVEVAGILCSVVDGLFIEFPMIKEARDDMNKMYEEMEKPMDDVKRREIFRHNGKALGYPTCCIEDFCLMKGKTDEQLEVGAKYNYGFIPCQMHSQQIKQGIITMESLISDRDPRFKPFPNE